MAIKGKGRTHGRRIIAAPPRPQLVIRKRPIWRRRATWVVVGALALAGILTAVFATVHASSRRHLEDTELAAIQAFTSTLQSKFPKDRTFVPPDAFIFYPTLGSDLDNLAKGKLSEADAVAKGKEIQASSRTASGAVGGLNITRMIPANFTVTGFVAGGSSAPAGSVASPGEKDIEATGATRQVLQDSQFLMAQAFQVWERVGAIVQAAATARGADQKALIEQAKQLNSQAAALFDRGYRKVLNIQSALGFRNPVTPSTPFQRAPSPVPSALPSASPIPTPTKGTPKPSPSSSASP